MKYKTCYNCCFAHKCMREQPCEDYCSTHSIAELDDTYYIERARESFHAEWFTYISLFYDETEQE